MRNILTPASGLTAGDKNGNETVVSVHPCGSMVLVTWANADVWKRSERIGNDVPYMIQRKG